MKIKSYCWQNTPRNRGGKSGIIISTTVGLERISSARLINLILVKDMSRLGRNHIEVGRLTDDVFPSLGIRFVAMNDRVDSFLGDDDMTAHRNLFNEFLSKDTSKKVRTVKRARMERGKYLGAYAPLGYKKDSLDKHHLIIDEETAHIVRRMFEMRCQGNGFRAIACIFNAEHIPSPKEAYYSRNGRKNPVKGNGVWNESTVSIAYLATYQRELRSAEERLVQLDSVIGTLYEDRVRGVITDSMFKNLMPKYEREREDKTGAVKILRDKVERSERQWCDTGAWVKTIRKYTDLEMLSQDILLVCCIVSVVR